jgi:hypothetical protein
MANRVKGTAEKKKKFLKALGKTCNVSEAARLSGLSRRYWYKAKEKDRKFSEAWDDAVEVGVDALEAEARRRAYEGWDEPVFYKGDATGVVRRYSDTLLIFLLKGARPKKYADFHRVEGGDTPIKIEILRFSDGNNGPPAK